MNINTLFMARFAAWGASSIANVLIPLLVFNLTGSSAMVGLGMLIQWAPRLIIPTCGLPYLLRTDPTLAYKSAEKIRLAAFSILGMIASDLSSFVPVSLKVPLVWLCASAILSSATVLLIIISGALATQEEDADGMILQAKLRQCDYASAMIIVPLVGFLVYRFNDFSTSFLLAIPLLLASLKCSRGFTAFAWDHRADFQLKTMAEVGGLGGIIKQSLVMIKRSLGQQRQLKIYALIMLLTIPAFVVFYTYPEFLEYKTTGYSHSYTNPDSEFFRTQIRVIESFVGVLVASCIVRFTVFKKNAIFLSSFMYLFGFITVHSFSMTVEEKLFLTMVWIAGFFMSMICWRSLLHRDTCQTKKIEATGATLTIDTIPPLLAGFALSLGAGAAVSWLCVAGFLSMLRPVMSLVESEDS